MEHKNFITFVHSACEILELELLEFSCDALEDGVYYNSQRPFNYGTVSKLQRRYGKFFGKDCGFSWFPTKSELARINPEHKHERIMCLLMFLEAEKDVIK